MHLLGTPVNLLILVSILKGLDTGSGLGTRRVLSTQMAWLAFLKSGVGCGVRSDTRCGILGRRLDVLKVHR